jgi:hypothetical protein
MKPFIHETLTIKINNNMLRLTDKAREDFLKWNKSYISYQEFESEKQFDIYLKENSLLIQAKTLVWLDSIGNLGNDRSFQDLVQFFLIDYNVKWTDALNEVIDKANKVYNEARQ